MKKRRRALKRIILASFLFVILITSLTLYKEIKYIPSPIELNQEIHLQKPFLDHYYIDLSKRKYLGREIHLDTDGVPLYQINGNGYYHPVYISQYALGAFEYYLNTGNKEAKKAFLTCAAWLRDNLRRHNDFFYWEYGFQIEFPGGLYKIPWFSAMAQGQGASVLLRAFCETRQEEYLSAAEKAIEPIFHTLSDGGISVVECNDYIFPQEYPTNPPSDILNGAITAYIGVYEYYKVTGDLRVKQFCDKIIRTFLAVIDQYDTGHWSLYSRRPKYLATRYYNSVHVAQLKALYLITEEEKFLKYSRKFESYQNNWVNRTRYIFATHRRQIKEFRFNDLRKIPVFIKRVLFEGTVPW